VPSGSIVSFRAGDAGRWLDVLVVGLLAAIAFLPGLFGDFVGWDDHRVFLDSVGWRGLGWPELRWMFTTFHMGHYRPLTWITLGADYILWGMRPAGYHLTSIALHAAAAVALLFAARRLLHRALGDGFSDAAVRAGAVGAALVFAVHPLRAEPVTWLSARADVLSGLLALLAVGAYLRACDQPAAERAGRGWYWASVVLFGLALLAKPMVVTLPLVLLVLDIYPLRRITGPRDWFRAAARDVWIEKVPFLLMAAAAAVLAVLARVEFRSVLDLEEFGARERVTAVVYGMALYVGKTIAPFFLSPLYDYRSVLAAGLWPLAFGVVVTGVLTIVAVLRRREWPGLAAVWTIQVLVLLPVSGLLQNGPQIAADRYTYLATQGWAVLAGAGVAWCAELWRRGRAHAGLGAGIIAASTFAIVGLVALTAWQTLIWQDSITLWRHAVRLDPRSPVAQVNLASALLPHDASEAHAHYARAVDLAPRLSAARQGLAFVLSLERRPEEAIAQAREAVRLRPGVGSWLFLGEALRVDGQFPEAIEAFREALRLRPADPAPRFRLAIALSQMGRHDEASSELDRGRVLARAAGLSGVDGELASTLIHQIESAPAGSAGRRDGHSQVTGGPTAEPASRIDGGPPSGAMLEGGRRGLLR
jgi:protein O-mannosyl-transferase